LKKREIEDADADSQYKEQLNVPPFELAFIVFCHGITFTVRRGKGSVCSLIIAGAHVGFRADFRRDIRELFDQVHVGLFNLKLQTSALDGPEENGDNGDHQQCVNESAGAITDISNSPKYDQYNSDYVK
jgi:hypothetical protein